MDLFRLQATLGLDTSQYDNGLDAAEDKGSSFGSKLKGGLATAGKVAAGAIAAIGTSATALGASFINSAKATADLGDEIDKTSQKLGISAEEYQKLAYAAKLSGTNVGTFEKAQKSLMSKGVKIPLTDALIKCAQAIDPVSEASELFGERVAMELTPMLNTGAEGIRGMMEEAEQYGIVMSDDAVKASAQFNDSLTKMKGTIGGLKNSLLSGFLPSMTEITDGVAKVFNGDEGGVAALQKGLDDMLNKITSNLPKFLERGGAIVSTLVNGIEPYLPQMTSAAVSIITTLINGFVANAGILLNGAATLFSNILAALPQLITDLTAAVPGIITAITDYFGEHGGELFDSAVELLGAVIDGIGDLVEKLTDEVPKIVNKITSVLSNKDSWNKVLSATLDLLGGVSQGIFDIQSSLQDAAGNIVVAIVNGILGKKDSAKKDMSSIGSELGESLISSWFDSIKNYFYNMVMKSPIAKLITYLLGFSSDIDLSNGIEGVKTQLYGKVNDIVHSETVTKAQAAYTSNPNDASVMQWILGEADMARYQVNLDVDKRTFGSVSTQTQNYNNFLIGRDSK